MSEIGYIPQATSTNSTSVLFVNFHKEGRELLTNFLATSKGLEYALKLFGREKTIWPDQCARAITAISSMSEPIQELQRLFEETSRLLENITPYFEITATLHYTNNQLHTVISLLKSFRSSCRLSPKKAEKQQQEISYKLNLFKQSSQNIQQSINEMLDEPFSKNEIDKLLKVTVDKCYQKQLANCKQDYNTVKKVAGGSKELMFATTEKQSQKKRDRSHLRVVDDEYVEEASKYPIPT